MGLLWRPLHFNAEAPTEPEGETVGAIYRTRRDCKSDANSMFASLLAFFVFCSVEVPSYIFLRKKTKFRTFLNSLQCVENTFSTRCRLLRKVLNFVFLRRKMCDGTSTEQKTKNAKSTANIKLAVLFFRLYY